MAAPTRAVSIRAHVSRTYAPVVLVAVAFFSLDPPRIFDFGALIPVALVLAVLVFLSTRRFGMTWLPTSVLAILVWFVLSTIWAVGKTSTAQHSISLCLVLITALAVGSRLTLPELARGVAAGGLLVLVVSVALAVLSPSYGLMPPGYEGGTLRGIYVHRNSLGAVLSLAASAAICIPAAGRRALAGKVALYVLLLLGVFSTQSSTALVSVAVMTVLYVLLRLTQRMPRVARVPGALVSVALVGLLVSYALTSPVAFAALNRSDDLTGRTQIWTAVQYLISQRPWIGYGWSGIWPIGSYLNLTVSATVGFLVPEAHNGYLDTLLQVGIIGFSLVAVLHLTVAARGLHLLATSRLSTAAWPLVLVGRAALYNYTESRFESPLELFVVCAVAACLIARARPASDDLPSLGAWGDRSYRLALLAGDRRLS